MTSVRTAGIEAQPHQPDIAHYVYCIVPVDGVLADDVCDAGLEGRRVYPVRDHRIAALVHDCPPEPYRAEDSATAAPLILAHHNTVQTAFVKLGSVLPMTFNTIVAPSGDRPAGANLAAWLEAEHDNLRTRLDALRGKAEYGLQILWSAAAVLDQIRQQSPDVRRLEAESARESRGTAYLLRQKLQITLKREGERWASELFTAVYERTGACSENVRVDKVSASGPERETAIKLSCLLARERVSDLQRLAAELGADDTLSVRLVGPLPPYSFCQP